MNTANFNGGDDDLMQLCAVKEDIDSVKGSTSGADTLVGDNMALGDDPFNGRHNNMFG